MIRLTSTPLEQAAARLENCRQAYEAIDPENEVPDAIKNCYRHPDVKASILAETNSKCAYCESKITHVYFGDVEHMLPKARFPELALDYDNLTLACAICNNKKGDYYNAEAPILHPYADIPEDQLVGLGPLIWHRNGSHAGQRTIDLLDLNRVHLNERRLECIQRLSSLADRYVREPDGPIKSTLLAQIRDECANSSEFSLIARSFLVRTYEIELIES